jgi:O-antigen ligase
MTDDAIAGNRAPRGLLSVSWEHLATGALVVLSIVFSLVPTSFTMTEIGPAATHEISGGSSIRQVQFGGLFMLAAFLCWRHASTSLRLLTRGLNPFMPLTLLYCGASTLWSAYPTISLKRTVLFLGLLLIGAAISPPIGSPRQFTRSTLVALTALCTASAVVAVALPHIGVDTMLGGAWRGILWQKNMLGSIAGIGVMLWLREWLARSTPGAICAAGFLICLLVLVMAKSATSILVTTMGIGIYLACRRTWLAGDTPALRIALGGAIVLILATHLWYAAMGKLPEWQDLAGPIAGLFNKSTDLTGRADIWRLTLYAAMEHPIWGIGYGAFWTGEDGPAQFIADALAWMPAHAHNGYIDIFNELGAVGSALVACLLLWHAVQLARLFWIDREDAAIHTAMFALILVSNFSESQLLAEVSFQNLMFIYSSVTVSATLGQARRARHSGAVT